MNFKRIQTFRIPLTVLVFSLSVPFLLQAQTAKPINFFGNWKAYFQGQDDDTAVDGFVQFRQLYNAAWTPLVTRKISFGANLGYSSNWVEDLGTRVIVNPSMHFIVKNDLFNLGLNGDVVKNNISFREDKQTSSWTTNLSSSWTNFLWPELILRAGQRFEEIAGNEFRSDTNSDYSFIGTSVSWKGYKMKLFYDYNRSQNNEDINLDSTQQDIEGHLGKFEYGDLYWNNKVSLNFSQLVYANTSDLSSAGGSSLLQVPVVSSYSGVDITPSSGTLPINQGLIDGNRDSTAVSIQLQQPVNLALRTNFKSVDSLYVYTTRDDKLLVANTSAVTWDLYTSSNGVSWQFVQGNVPSSFNNTDFRFEILTGRIRAEYMKLVVTGWMPALDVDVTEIEAYRFFTEADGGNYNQDSTTYKTELYLGVVPVDRTRFNYTFSWDRTDSEGAEDSSVEQIVQNATFNWDYSQYFVPSVGFSTVANNNDRPGAADTESRTYNVQVRSVPLPTVDLSLSTSLSEYYENGDRQRSSNNISLTTLAALYPDLSSEFTVGYNQGKSDITDEKDDGYFINFIMHSQLRKSLNVELQSNYSFSNADLFILEGGHSGHGSSTFESTSGQGGETLLTISWRTSDILSFSLRGYSLYGQDIESDYGGYFNANYLVFRTSKTNLTLTYWLNAGSDKDTVNNFGMVWGWDLSSYFTLQTSGNYIIAEDGDSWNFYSQLTAKF